MIRYSSYEGIVVDVDVVVVVPLLKDNSHANRFRVHRLCPAFLYICIREAGMLISDSRQIWVDRRASAAAAAVVMLEDEARNFMIPLGRSPLDVFIDPISVVTDARVDAR